MYPALLIKPCALYSVSCRPILPGLYLKDIPSETAEFIAKYWSPATIEYPLQHRIQYLKDIIVRFGMLGIYSIDDSKYPVAWCGLKPGNLTGH